MLTPLQILSKHYLSFYRLFCSSAFSTSCRRFSNTPIVERTPNKRTASKLGKSGYLQSLVRLSGIATVSSIALGIYLYRNETHENYATWTGGALRFLRSLSVGGMIFGDYVWSMKGFRFDSDKGASNLHNTHLRCARRLLELCKKNGGLYIKIGQHIAQLDYLLPDEYCHTLLPLVDACPTQSLSDVYITFIEDLGTTPDQLFNYFDSNPFASASLAQVHRAVTHSGQKVAVKLQHRGLKEAAKGDIATVAFLVDSAAFLFPDFDYQWLVNEIRENLPKELDFIHEARNAERCRTNFGNRLDVTTPDIFWNLSSSRILTMSFEEGCRLDDAESMKSVGLSPADVSRIVSEVFNEQIFLHGFVHCDPHIGNILVRPRADKPKSPLIVMLDHGLYRELSPDLRLSYAKMWRSIVLGDRQGIIESSKALGVGDYYELFAQLLTTRPWRDIVSSEVDLDRLKMPNSEEYRLRIQKYAVSAVTDISHLLGHLPRPLLLLLKTNDCLRSVDRALGAPLNTFIITARYCAKAIEQAELRSAAMGHVSERLLGHFRARRDRLAVEFRIFLFRFYIWLNILLHALKEFLPKNVFIQRQQVYS
ncbi:hypothetical protein GpartN1_g2439.t1 [Galdieria partita]|uniref:ABC1 atypical kinase-like domain-containing protein n=1 Tax=Galdieria partita TaxID=83374 RepID=A0A9C7PTT8_9RHOD|nr:hypothetical protein GpartN1_g2439.t1 [Galdieria partita]